MLILSRCKGERVTIGHDTELTVLEIRGKRVRLGITAPATTPILRGELPCRNETDREVEHASLGDPVLLETCGCVPYPSSEKMGSKM